MKDVMFEKSFERVIGHEGNYQAMPNDRGNWTKGVVGEGELKGTKFGISAMTYPDTDIQNLTIDDAKRIYFSDFWIPISVISLPEAMLYQYFDATINHGRHNAAKMLQRAIGAEPDGIVGAATLQAVRESGKGLPQLFIAERIAFYTQVKTFDSYGKGWMNRVSENLKYLVEDQKS